MKRILFFAKHETQIQANSAVFNTGNELTKVDIHSKENNISVEMEVMTKVFIAKGWQCFWTCRNWIDLTNNIIQCFNPETKNTDRFLIDTLSNCFEVIIFRSIGSVEGNRDNIVKVIETLQNHFQGLIINHPETIKYGIRKDYVLELQSNGFPIIETQYFDKNVSYSTLIKSIKPKQQYIIKPTTGELSNSLAVIENDTEIYDVKNEQNENGETYLRRKERLVGGWLLQPLMKDIWDGEYQLVFFGNNFSHGCKKEYEKSLPDMKVPSQKFRNISLYTPTEQEKEIALSVKSFFENKLHKPIYTFRFDFLKQKNDNGIKIVEFEFLNPGFFIGYIGDNDKKIDICTNFEREVVRLINYYDTNRQ